MIYESFSIKNFRSFLDVTVRSLGHVNLIAGKNGAGKTSLLEALFVHLGPHNPRLPLRVNAWRGIDRVTSDAYDVWGWLFHERSVNTPIRLEGRNRQGVGWSLALRLVEAEELPFDRETSSTNGAREAVGSSQTTGELRRLVLDFQDTSGRASQSRALFTSDSLKFEGDSFPPFPQGVFISANVIVGQSEVDRFSRLEAENRQENLLIGLRIINPSIKRLSILTSGGAPSIYADIGLKRLAPVQILGQGLSRLLSILLAIADSPGGVVLVDEIENGLHHSLLTQAWKSIGAAARRADTQVFATTHSWECIRAAHQAFEELRRDPHDAEQLEFRLHRLESRDGTTRQVVFDPDTLDAALSADLEIR
jgi:energy-coupling factor transporter ATP-binding protein EcfA2